MKRGFVKMKPKWIKLGALLCFTTFLMCGFQSPFPGDLSAASFAQNDTSHTASNTSTADWLLSSSASSADSPESSAVSSAAGSSAAGSTASSKAASSGKAASKKTASKPASVVKTTPKVATKKDLAEDPEKGKEAPAPAPKPAPKPASSAPVSSKPASGAGSSSPASSAVVQPPFSGWKTVNGARTYFRNDVMLKGWNTLDGSNLGEKYFFDQNGAVKTRLGIDVSIYQGNIDWNKVKADGIDFVLIRLGYRGVQYGTCKTDPNFRTYYNGATAAGLKVGVYFFTQAITVGEGVEEASYIIKEINGLNITGPIAFDTESASEKDYRDDVTGQIIIPRANHLPVQLRTDIAASFCEVIKSAGYTPMIYSGLQWLNNNLDMSQLSSYKTWVAQYFANVQIGEIYNKKVYQTDTSQWVTDYSRPYQYWQYTSRGSVNGISTGVDMNISFD